MDLSRLTNGAKIAGIAGILLIIDLFLPWYSVSGFGQTINFNAFDSAPTGLDFFGWLGVFIAIAAAVILVLKALGQADVKIGSFAAEQLALVLGALGAIMILIRWLTETSFTSFGIYLGIVAAAFVAYGAFMDMRAAGLDMPDMDDFKSIGGGDAPPPPPGGDAPPPPPPPGG